MMKMSLLIWFLSIVSKINSDVVLLSVRDDFVVVKLAFPCLVLAGPNRPMQNACQAGGSQSSSSVAILSGIFGLGSNPLGHLPFGPIRPYFHACKSGGSKSSSSVAIQSGIFYLLPRICDYHLEFNSSLRPSALSALSLVKETFQEFWLLARLSGSGLAPLQSRPSWYPRFFKQTSQKNPRIVFVSVVFWRHWWQVVSFSES